MKQWSAEEAAEYLRSCTKSSSIPAQEWNAICSVMAYEKNEIIDAFFPQESSLNEKETVSQEVVKQESTQNKRNLLISEPKKVTQKVPTVAEIDTWTPAQAGDFIRTVNVPSSIGDEIWDALRKSTEKT